MSTAIPIRTMQAFRMFDWRDGGRLCEVPVPGPGQNEVRLRVGGNGLCQSDLHALDDLCCSPPHLDVQLPMTLGHEIALAATGRLRINLHRHPLDEVPQILHKMRRGEIVGRAVIVPNETYR